MIEVMQIKTDTEGMHAAGNGLMELSQVIGVLFEKVGRADDMTEEEAADAVRAAERYLKIGAAACHLLAGCMDEISREDEPDDA